MQTNTRKCFPNTETNEPSAAAFRAALVDTLSVASRSEVASTLEVTPQGVGLWDHGRHAPPPRKRASMIRKLASLKTKKERTRDAKAARP